MATIKYAAPNSIETVFTTGLNNLANDGVAVSANVSNDATEELYLYADFEIYLATQGSARSAGAHVEIYIIQEIDGTNYSYGGTGLPPNAALKVGNFAYDAAVTARYTHIRGVKLPPADFEVVLINRTGQAFAASGNTLKMVRYNLQSA